MRITFRRLFICSLGVERESPPGADITPPVPPALLYVTHVCRRVIYRAVRSCFLGGGGEVVIAGSAGCPLATTKAAELRSVPVHLGDLRMNHSYHLRTGCDPTLLGRFTGSLISGYLT